VIARIALLSAACLFAQVGTVARGAGDDATDIMTKAFYVSKVVGSVQSVTMVLKTESGAIRVRKTAGFTKLQSNGKDSNQVVRFLSPPDVKNTSNLMIEHSDGDDDIWIYLPALKKVRRIVASNKKDSFVGSDFSYGDVIGQRVEDWAHTVVAVGAVDGAKTFVVESRPKTEDVKGTTGYSKIRRTIRQDSFVTLKGEYWDLGGRPLKEILYSEFKEVDPAKKKWLAMKVEAKNLQTGHSTLITYDSFKLDAGIRDEVFTTHYLEKEQ
jgi:outer membrane lipoprotein-sorting protein